MVMIFEELFQLPLIVLYALYIYVAWTYQFELRIVKNISNDTD